MAIPARAGPDFLLSILFIPAPGPRSHRSGWVAARRRLPPIRRPIFNGLELVVCANTVLVPQRIAGSPVHVLAGDRGVIVVGGEFLAARLASRLDRKSVV